MYLRKTRKKLVIPMGKKLSKLLLSTALLATTAASLTALTQIKKGQAMESETRETRNLSAIDEKIAQIDNPTIKAFLEYYANQNMTSTSSLPMIDDLEANTRIIVIDIDYADTSIPPAIGTSVDGSEGPVGGTVDADGQYIEFDTSDHSKSATVQEIRDAIAEILG